MTTNIKSVGIASKARGIFVGPCNSTAHLVRHDADVPIRGAHRNEIKRDVIYTSIDEKFRRKAEVLRFSGLGLSDVVLPRALRSIGTACASDGLRPSDAP